MARKPNANPFLRLNQCAATATSGPNANPENSCQSKVSPIVIDIRADRRSTYPDRKALAEKKLPVDLALRD